MFVDGAKHFPPVQREIVSKDPQNSAPNDLFEATARNQIFQRDNNI